MRKIMWLCINKFMKKYEIAYHNYAEANPASDIVCSVKTTMYDQNNNILWYFQIFKAQKSSKCGWTVQGIVQFGLLLLCTESTLFSIELPENCIYLSQSELSNFFIYLIRSATVWMITKSDDHIAGVWFVNHVYHYRLNLTTETSVIN